MRNCRGSSAGVCKRKKGERSGGRCRIVFFNGCDPEPQACCCRMNPHQPIFVHKDVKAILANMHVANAKEASSSGDQRSLQRRQGYERAQMSQTRGGHYHAMRHRNCTGLHLTREFRAVEVVRCGLLVQFKSLTLMELG